MANTTCDLCTDEINDMEVNLCAVCGRDGLCNDCLSDHGCDAIKAGGGNVDT